MNQKFNNQPYVLMNVSITLIVFTIFFAAPSAVSGYDITMPGGPTIHVEKPRESAGGGGGGGNGGGGGGGSGGGSTSTYHSGGGESTVRHTPGSPTGYPNVVWGEDGKARPQQGYQWLRPHYVLYRGDYSVVLILDGTPAGPSDFTDLSWKNAHVNGHIVWNGNGSIRPMRGYEWYDHDEMMKCNDFRVIPLEPTAQGIELPAEVEDSPGVLEARKGAEVAASGQWKAAWAWYVTALRKDPKNATLKRMVDDAADHVKRNR